MTRSTQPVENRVSAARVGSLFYEKAAGMLMAVGAVATTSDAAIIHWEGAGVTDTGNLAPSGSLVSLQLIGTGFGSTAYGFVKGIGALSLPTDSLSGFFREATAPTVGQVGGAFGPVGGRLDFAKSASSVYVQLNNASFTDDNLFAFSFTSGAVNGGDPVYGWARIDVPFPGSIIGATIVEWAYDDTGDPISLGSTTAIPEPSSLALLAAGAVGGVACFHRHRNRRKQAAA